MKFKKIFILSFVITIMVNISACYYDNEEDLYGDTPADCSTEVIKYSVQVTGILQKSCYKCHATGSNLGGILLDSYNSVRSTATSGLLLGVINHAPGFSPMPQGAPKLSNCDIQALQTWLDNGTPNN